MPDEDLESYITNNDLPDDAYLISDDTREPWNLIVRESSHASLINKSIVKINIKTLYDIKAIKEENSSDDEEDKESTDNEGKSSKNNELFKKIYKDEKEEFLLKSRSLLTSLKLGDFKLIKELGKGGFGAVMLARDPNLNFYAMKRIRKDKLLELDAVNGFIIERNILSKQKHPFILSLKHVFETDLRYYLFWEYVPGGDIYSHLRRQLNGFDLETIWFFGWQIILALEHLHNNGYIHWDLKPENILIDEDGYLKLADFGISKHIDDLKQESSIFGTYEYMAPEIIQTTKFNKKFQIDWWAFGVLLYELRFKKSPFKADSIDKITEKIVNEEVRFPPMGDEPGQKQFKKLVRDLLTKDPEDRLGYSADGRGASDIKEHKFFDKFDFDKIFKRKYESPYNPHIDPKLIKKYEKADGLTAGVAKNLEITNGFLGDTKLDSKVEKNVKKRFDREKRKYDKK